MARGSKLSKFAGQTFLFLAFAFSVVQCGETRRSLMLSVDDDGISPKDSQLSDENWDHVLDWNKEQMAPRADSETVQAGDSAYSKGIPGGLTLIHAPSKPIKIKDASKKRKKRLGKYPIKKPNDSESIAVVSVSNQLKAAAELRGLEVKGDPSEYQVTTVSQESMGVSEQKWHLWNGFKLSTIFAGGDSFYHAFTHSLLQGILLNRDVDRIQSILRVLDEYSNQENGAHGTRVGVSRLAFLGVARYLEELHETMRAAGDDEDANLWPAAEKQVLEPRHMGQFVHVFRYIAASFLLANPAACFYRGPSYEAAYQLLLGKETLFGSYATYCKNKVATLGEPSECFGIDALAHALGVNVELFQRGTATDGVASYELAFGFGQHPDVFLSYSRDSTEYASLTTNVPPPLLNCYQRAMAESARRLSCETARPDMPSLESLKGQAFMWLDSLPSGCGHSLHDTVAADVVINSVASALAALCELTTKRSQGNRRY